MVKSTIGCYPHQGNTAAITRLVSKKVRQVKYPNNRFWLIFREVHKINRIYLLSLGFTIDQTDIQQWGQDNNLNQKQKSTGQHGMLSLPCGGQSFGRKMWLAEGKSQRNSVIFLSSPAQNKSQAIMRKLILLFCLLLHEAMNAFKYERGTVRQPMRDQQDFLTSYFSPRDSAVSVLCYSYLLSVQL